jgi:hypothetical protein
MNFDPSFLAGPLAVAGATVTAGVALLFLWRRHVSRQSHIRRKSLFTPNEAEFFHRLQRALPTYEVFPQVSLAALLTDDGALSRKAQWGLRARFDRKMVDFVIWDRRTLNVVALVELDDRTHVASADRKRDALTSAAGYQTLRFQSKQKPSVAEIAALFEHARAWIA